MIRRISLLILDFDGVCTYTRGELPNGEGAAVGWATVIRPEATAAVVTAAEAEVTTVILSNEISPSWVDEVPLLAQVDRVVACSDNGIFKPDRRAFQRCLLLTGHRAEETLVVDDHPDNIAVARSLGMEALLLDPTDPIRIWERVTAALTGP